MAEVLQFVQDKNGMQYAVSKINQFRKKAEDILSQFPESEYQSSLKKLIAYTVERQA